MTPEQFEIAEQIGLNLFFLAIFVFIGLAIQDVLKQGKVPKYGRVAVWAVLFLGCAGFIAKGVIQFIWETNGL